MCLTAVSDNDFETTGLKRDKKNWTSYLSSCFSHVTEIAQQVVPSNEQSRYCGARKHPISSAFSSLSPSLTDKSSRKRRRRMRIAGGKTEVTAKVTVRSASPSVTRPPLRHERAPTIADDDPSSRKKQERTAATNRGRQKAALRTVTNAGPPELMGKPVAEARVVAIAALAAGASTAITGHRGRGKPNVERKGVVTGGTMRTRANNGKNGVGIDFVTENEQLAIGT